MDHGSLPSGDATQLDVVGLGPGDLARVSSSALALLRDPTRRVILRTLRHPAAEELAAERDLEVCDDLYEAADRFEDVYAAIADRVLSAARSGSVVFAVPGSPLVGELSVGEIRRRSEALGLHVEVHPGESFVDAVLHEIGVDPLRDGLQILNGHDLPTPLVMDKPTIVAHCDLPVVLADVVARIGRVVPEGTELVILVDIGSADRRVVRTTVESVDVSLAGPRTSLFLHPEPGGLLGVVHVMRRLREECPWDRRQTHRSLVKNLIEETHELAEALSMLPEDELDWGAYADVEDELGDVLLQVLFHAAIARQADVFDIDDVGEALRQKLVRRHPHVFGDVEVSTAEEVKDNWDRIKAEERGGQPVSVIDGVPTGMPALARAAKLQNRAAKVGFDWQEAAPVLDKVREEIEELASVLDEPAAEHELGDVLFSVVNLARHLRLDPEVSLRRSIERFVTRFRAMEQEGPLQGLSPDELEARWERAKRAEGRGSEDLHEP